MQEGIEQPTNANTPPHPNKRLFGKKLLGSLGIFLSSFSVLPACSETPTNASPAGIEIKAGDSIPVISGEIKPSHNINVRSTPTVMDTVDGIRGNKIGELTNEQTYDIKDAQIVRGFDVDPNSENADLWLRVYNQEQQRYEYISMWALRGSLDVKEQSEILISQMDENGNIFIIVDGQIKKISSEISQREAQS